MKTKRIVAVILLVSICLQCTSCIYVQDAFYDMGIYIDFDEAWEEIQAEWNNIRSNFSSDIVNKIDEFIGNISTLFNNKKLPDTAIPIDDSAYYLDFPLEKIYLPASGRTIFLLPLNGYGKVSAFRRSDNEEVSLKEAGMDFDLARANGKFTLDSYGTICGVQGGMGQFTVTYSQNGQVLEKVENIQVWVVEHDYSVGGNYYTLSAEETEYATIALDLYYSLYKANDYSASLEWHWWDNILLNINNLSENLIATLKRDESIEERKEKRIFRDFFEEYTRNNIPEEIDSSNWNLMMNSLKILDELRKVIGNIKELPQNVTNAIDNAVWLYEKFSDLAVSAISRDEIARLNELLDIIYSDSSLRDYLMKTEEGITWLREQHTTYEALIKGKNYFGKLITDNAWDEFVDKGFKKNGAWDKAKIAGEVIQAGFNLFDAISFAVSDHNTNVQYLKILRDGYMEYQRQDSVMVDGSDGEYLDIMIEEYTHKYWTAVSDLQWKTVAQAVEFVAGMNPIYSVSSFVASIVAKSSSVSDKEKVMVLSLYADIAYHSLGIYLDSMFAQGKIAGELDTMKYYASLYLNLLVEINTTLLQIAPMEEQSEIRENINFIEKDLANYLKY